jgi:hypothetical protein
MTEFIKIVPEKVGVKVVKTAIPQLPKPSEGKEWEDKQDFSGNDLFATCLDEDIYDIVAALDEME